MSEEFACLGCDDVEVGDEQGYGGVLVASDKVSFDLCWLRDGRPHAWTRFLRRLMDQRSFEREDP